MEEDDYNLLAERIDAFVEDEVRAAQVELRPLRGEFSRAGAYNSSRRLAVENEILVDFSSNSLARIAWYIFQAADGDPRARALFESSANKLADHLAARMATQRDTASSSGLPSRRDFESTMQSQLVEQLAAVVKNARADFRFNISGGQLLKKGADINVTTVMKDSPGGVQAVAGAGDVSQTVTQQQYAALIGAIDAMLGSSDFRALGDKKREELGDLAEVIRDEAKKEKPDREKVMRWGERLVNTAQQLGMQAAASGVGSALADLLKSAF